MREYDFFPDFDKEKERLLSLTKEINVFQIDDLKQSINIAFNSSLAGGLFKSEKIKIDEDVIENIKSFAKATKIEIKDSFFDIGNAGKRFSGFSSISGYLGPSVKYEETGSSKSIKKYEMIVELNDKISRLIEWLSFLDNIRDYKFIQLAISEIGNISDEEIEVNIEFTPLGTTPYTYLIKTMQGKCLFLNMIIQYLISEECHYLQLHIYHRLVCYHYIILALNP